MRTTARIEPVKTRVGMSVLASVNAAQSVALSALFQLRDGSSGDDVGHHCCCCCCLSSVELEPHGGHRIMATTLTWVGGVCKSRCPIRIGTGFVAIEGTEVRCSRGTIWVVSGGYIYASGSWQLRPRSTYKYHEA